ncbi:MAG: sigma-70 family RNA polymerase sigma factor [Myxococcota bacterium]|nr:sigma-70 family RNA polymerase sigma factor [Myxococcota bacterium]
MVPPRELNERIRQCVDASEAKWPTFRLPRVEFERRLRAVIDGQEDNPFEALARIRAPDLYIAHACAMRIPGAVTTFTSTYLTRLEEDLRHFKIPQVLGEDVRRELEDTLLLGSGEVGPKIAQYEGRGPLRRFVATAARNAAISLLRRRSRDPDVDVDAIQSQLTPCAESVRRGASPQDAAVRDAVRASLSALDRRQRMIVRLHLSRGVALTQIAKMLGVHQSTVSRTFDAALQRLHRDIRRHLREDHGFKEKEMESAIREVRSQLDLSLSRALRDTGIG